MKVNNVVPQEKPPLRVPTLTADDLNVKMEEVFSIQSKSGQSDDMMTFISSKLAALTKKFKHFIIEKDEYGNIYVTKGKATTYPVFACHTDTVHALKDDFHVVRSPKGNWYGFSEDDDEFALSGIGGDDKCGILVVLELLYRIPVMKGVFYKDEEIGCKGSEASDMDFYDDSRYAIQVDRKGNGDIITVGSTVELCSPEFKSFIGELGAVYNYTPTTGARTDVVALKKLGLEVSVCNLSAGYYNPHRDAEYINERDLLNVLEFCIAISKHKTVYPHKYVAPTYAATRSYTPNTAASYPAATQSAVKTTAACLQRRCLECSAIGNMYYPICEECIADALPEEDKAIFAMGIAHYPKAQLSAQDNDTEEFVLMPYELTDEIRKFYHEFQETFLADVQLPLKQCSLCSVEMITPWERARGFCLDCEMCGECQEYIRSIYGLIHQMCEECSSLVCGVCKEANLYTDIEAMERICAECASRMRLKGI